jgi:(E)-4-hydroxy-3-methylbut-2-enyl-diphosphate synthase
MVETVRLLVQTMDKENMAFPLHLGVTEAGEGEDGRIKSAVGIGALLADGIGDTVRVSLSEEPEAEIPVAKALVDYFANPNSTRYNDKNILSYNEDKKSIFFFNTEDDWEQFQLQSAAECGRLLWQYGCNKLEIRNPNFSEKQVEKLSKDILQAARIKMYKTEFISCPGCGRTMFDLQKTVADIKAAIGTKLNGRGLKIAIM